jgi:hypothetical protein
MSSPGKLKLHAEMSLNNLEPSIRRKRACRNQCFAATAAAAIPSNSAKVCGASVN